jgi:hypothetical protein
MSNHERLVEELIKLSQSKKWDEAKLEWDLVDVEEVEEAETCICGHTPIREICTIKNTKTGAMQRVGNSCVKKFNNRSDKIFRAVDKIRKDITKSVNAEALEMAHDRKWIKDTDYNFYINIFRKRHSTLSFPQKKWKYDLNQRILRSISKG